jgi:predicted adenylyl cyclase CyaB
MNEIEVKILDVDFNKTVVKLKSLGAKKVFEGDLDTIIYDYPDNSLHKNNQHLRLRKEGKKTFLTFKQKLISKSVKSADEIEIEVADMAKTAKLLFGLGLKKIKIFSKKRISYKLKDAKFEFDKLDGIPLFIEMEVEDKKIIAKYLKLLGFKKSDAKPWSGKNVIDYYSSKK